MALPGGRRDRALTAFCHIMELIARSASTRVSWNQSAPSFQCMLRYSVRNAAHTCWRHGMAVSNGRQPLRRLHLPHHSDALLHPTGGPQLPHTRIDKRVSGLALLPCT